MVIKSCCLIDIETSSNSEQTLHLSLSDDVEGWIVKYAHRNKVVM